MKFSSELTFIKITINGWMHTNNIFKNIEITNMNFLIIFYVKKIYSLSLLYMNQICKIRIAHHNTFKSSGFFLKTLIGCSILRYSCLDQAIRPDTGGRFLGMGGSCLNFW